MVSLSDIDDTYILESYIAESHAIDATISDVCIYGDTHVKNIYIRFSIGEVSYDISVRPSFDGENGDIIDFVDELNVDVDSDFSITDLEGSNVEIGVNDSLDTITFSKDGPEYDIETFDDDIYKSYTVSNKFKTINIDEDEPSLSEDEIQDFNTEIVRNSKYVQNKKTENGWTTKIINVTPKSEGVFEIEVDACDLVWELEVENTRDREESAVIDFIEKVGKPSFIEEEKVTIVKSDDIYHVDNALSKCGDWYLVDHSNHSELTGTKSEPNLYSKIDKNTTDDSTASNTSSNSPNGNSGNILLPIAIIFFVILVIGLAGGVPQQSSTAVESTSPPTQVEQERQTQQDQQTQQESEKFKFDEDKPISYSVSVDHQYPDGRLSVILSEEPEELIIQGDSDQYTFTDETLVHLRPDSEDNAKYKYVPGETVVIIARDDNGGQKTIFYNTQYSPERAENEAGL